MFITGPKNDPETNPVGHWPWMSSLGHYEGDKWIHQCGATLVSSKHFLTAAHCVTNTTNLKILIGNFNFSLTKSQQRGIVIDIRYIKVHPQYNYKNSYFDIAIITTDNIDFTINIQPICLPEYSSTDIHKYDNNHVELLGWGAITRSGTPSKLLKKVAQVIFPNKYCNSTHIREDKEKDNIQTAVPNLFPSHLICAGTDHKSQASCTGDSGGPLQFYDTDKYHYRQVGVVHGSVSHCGQSAFPGIYVRLDDPAIFDFLKSSTQESRFNSRESDLHLIVDYSLQNYSMVVFNWRQNNVCNINTFRYFLSKISCDSEWYSYVLWN